MRGIEKREIEIERNMDRQINRQSYNEQGQKRVPMHPFFFQKCFLCETHRISVKMCVKTASIIIVMTEFHNQSAFPQKHTKLARSQSCYLCWWSCMRRHTEKKTCLGIDVNLQDVCWNSAGTLHRFRDWVSIGNTAASVFQTPLTC